MTAWAIDLDGVIWRGTEPVPGASEAVAALRDGGHSVAFVTNSAARTPAQVAAKLALQGIDDAEELVVTSAMAAATLVQPGERVFVVGGAGLRQALIDVDAELVDDGGPVDAVAVGITPDFDYAMLHRAMTAIRAGARFIASNDDSTFPTESGLLPGAGALIAAVQTATDVPPEIAGKPHGPMAELVRSRFGTEGIMVGDRPETDGLFGQRLGYHFALVLSGVTVESDLPVEPTPKYVTADIAELVANLL